MARILFIILFSVIVAFFVMTLSGALSDSSGMTGGAAVLLHGFVGFIMAIIAGTFISRQIKSYAILNTILVIVVLSISTYISLQVSEANKESQNIREPLPIKEQSFFSVLSYDMPENP